METEKTISEWIEEWTLLYPQNIKWNGMYLRAKPAEVLKKMVNFCKTFPQYTKPIIFAATKAYLEQQKNKNWEYTKRASYIIDKKGEPSVLEHFCEMQLSPSDNTENIIVNNFHNDFI